MTGRFRAWSAGHRRRSAAARDGARRRTSSPSGARWPEPIGSTSMRSVPDVHRALSPTSAKSWPSQTIRAGCRRLRIHCAYDPATIMLGASIACAGPCLTVVAFGPRDRGGAWFEVDAAAETLARTTVGAWTIGTRVNLERSLKIGDELGGHIVTGHVDGVADDSAARDRSRAGEGAWGATARFRSARRARSPASSRKRARWLSTAPR